MEYKEVLETYENETDELIHVHVNGEDIVTTPSHPFYVNQFGWTRAAQLRAGDVLVLSNGEYVVVEFIQHEILESPVKVYNLEVEDYHTYFVGENSVLVHNGCKDKNAWNQFQQDHAGETNPQTGKKYTRTELAEKYQATKSQGSHYLHRPYLRKETVDAIKSKMRIDANGRKYDEIGRKWLEPDAPMDIGHMPEYELWYMRDIAEQQGMTQAEFNNHMNQPKFYAMQEMHENRSRVHEAIH